MCVTWPILSLAAAEPPRTPPPVVMPAPNARDVYIQAYGLLRSAEDLGIDPYGPAWKPGPGEDPFLDDPRLEARARYVEANAAALAKLREALPLEFREPPIISFATTLPHYARYRELARLLQMEAQLRAVEMDWPGALDACLDAVEMGNDTRQGGPLIGDLVGIAIAAIGRASAWDIVPELSANELRDAMPRLRRLCDQTPPDWQVLEWELAGLRPALIEVMDEPQALAGLFEAGADEARAVRAYLDATPREQVLAAVDAWCAAAIEETRRPWPPGGPPPIEEEELTPLLRVVVPAYGAARMRHLVDEAADRMLLLTLALHVHRLEHGALPETVEALVPAVLPAPPADPFAPHRPLGYRLADGRPLIWSVGPDGDDDGGRPFERAGGDGDRFRVFGPGDEGDLVAGVNVR